MREPETPGVPAMVAVRRDAKSANVPGLPGHVEEAEWQRWGWLQHWEFWLAMALGAFLRLWQIGTTQFLDDQTGLYVMARESILRHAIALTGIPSSIGTLNPPLSVYILLPFAAMTANPLAAVVALALWNIVGVALCYIFGLRYFGRRVAAVGTLLFATGGAALNYSRFLWQQNYLPPLLVLWALTLYMGAVRGERRWLAGNIVLLILAIQLHPTSILLAPVTVVAILLAPQLPPVRAYVVVAIVAVLLFVPTLIFELTSRGSDLRTLAHYVLSGGRFNLRVLPALWGALDGPGSADLGPLSPYANAHLWYFVITWAVVIVILSGWVVLTVRVFRPAVAIWRETTVDGTQRALRGLAERSAAIWRDLRADATWRARFLLWFWVTFPPATMLHNSGALFIHYLLVIFPALFLIGGFGIEWVLTHFSLRAIPALKLGRRVVPALALAILTVAVVGEGARMLLYSTSVATGHYVAYDTYGYPLDELLTLDGQLSTLQQRQGAAATYIVVPAQPRYGRPAEYLLTANHPDRVASTSTCAVVPTAASGASLVVSLAPDSPVNALLAVLPNAHVAAKVPMAGGEPLVVYRIAGAMPMLADDTPMTSVAFLNASGEGVRLDAVSAGTPNFLRLRWTVVGAPPAGPGLPFYRIRVALPGTPSASISPVDCMATHLRAGDTLFTWVPMPAPTPSATVSAELIAGTALTVSAGTQDLKVFSLGPLRFLTDESGGTPPQPLPAGPPR